MLFTAKNAEKVFNGSSREILVKNLAFKQHPYQVTISKALLDMFAKWFTPLAPPFSIISMSKDPSARSMKSQMHQKTLKKSLL